MKQRFPQILFMRTVEAGARSARRAFTLVEMLAVIAIISILAALLLVVLGKAKNHAGKLTDMDNLRQIMIAVHLYCGDNSDVLPPPNWGAGAPDNPRSYDPGWLYTVDSNIPYGDPAKFRVDTGLLWNTLHNPKIYFCPLDVPSAPLFKERPQQISSYGMNGGTIGYRRKLYPPQKMAAMWSGACAFWETDENFPRNFNDGANFPDQGVSDRHLAGGVQALFDGSVSYVKTNLWHQDASSRQKNRLWCWPESSNGR